MTGADAVVVRTAARLLATTGSAVGIAALLLAALAGATLALTDPVRPWPLWLAALLGPVALERTVRVRFDAALFADLADRAENAEASADEALRTLDHALAVLFPRRARAARPLAQRLDGARRLAVSQAAVVAVQAALVLFSLLPL